MDSPQPQRAAAACAEGRSPPGRTVAAKTALKLLLLSAVPVHIKALGVADIQEFYSTNAICRQRYCINPVFPGLQDLAALEASTWQCQPGEHAGQFLHFCKGVVNYDMAIKSPNTTATLQSLVEAQEAAAITAYYYHLAGMNLEAAAFKEPQHANDECVVSIWQMVCQTHFPKAQAGCDKGKATKYLRPCKNVCENYVNKCGVQCCDESVQCAFTQEINLVSGETVIETGYADQLGPSATCTGSGTSRGAAPALAMAVLLAFLHALPMPVGAIGPGASSMRHGARGGAGRVGSSPRWSHALLALLAPFAAVGLQGCNIVGHATAAWEDKPSYLVSFSYLPIDDKLPAGTFQIPATEAVLNSCELKNLPAEQQCSGNGVCKQWSATSTLALPVSFCECRRDWADPECRTKRKSQAIAFTLSLLFGYVGVDHFYLGEYFTGLIKLSTLGGVGFWWVLDIVRIGSSPIYTSAGFRLAGDLPHWVYVMVTTAAAAILGFVVFTFVAPATQKRRQKAKALLQAEADFFKSRSATVNINPLDQVGMATRQTYGIPMPVDVNYGTLAPEAAKRASLGNPMTSYSLYVDSRAYVDAALGVEGPAQQQPLGAMPPTASPEPFPTYEMQQQSGASGPPSRVPTPPGTGHMPAAPEPSPPRRPSLQSQGVPPLAPPAANVL